MNDIAALETLRKSNYVAQRELRKAIYGPDLPTNSEAFDEVVIELARLIRQGRKLETRIDFARIMEEQSA